VLLDLETKKKAARDRKDRAAVTPEPSPSPSPTQGPFAPPTAPAIAIEQASPAIPRGDGPILMLAVLVAAGLLVPVVVRTAGSRGALGLAPGSHAREILLTASAITFTAAISAAIALSVGVR
jgi:hypothetical protein